MPEFDPHEAIKELAEIGAFAALQVPCRQIHNKASEDYRSIRSSNCAEVGCRGWTPESDVEKAAARVHAAYLHDCFCRTPAMELEAAQEWVGRQHD